MRRGGYELSEAAPLLAAGADFTPLDGWWLEDYEALGIVEDEETPEVVVSRQSLDG